MSSSADPLGVCQMDRIGEKSGGGPVYQREDKKEMRKRRRGIQHWEAALFNRVWPVFLDGNASGPRGGYRDLMAKKLRAFAKKNSSFIKKNRNTRPRNKGKTLRLY